MALFSNSGLRKMCSPAFVASDSTRPPRAGTTPAQTSAVRSHRTLARPLSSTSTRWVAGTSLGEGMPVIRTIAGDYDDLSGARVCGENVCLVGLAEAEPVAHDDLGMQLPACQIDGKALHVLKRRHPRGADRELFVQQQVRHLGVQPAPFANERDPSPFSRAGNGSGAPLDGSRALDDPGASLASRHVVHQRNDTFAGRKDSIEEIEPRRPLLSQRAGLHAIDAAGAPYPPPNGGRRARPVHTPR